jgi:hypothetical protein
MPVDHYRNCRLRVLHDSVIRLVIGRFSITHIVDRHSV